MVKIAEITDADGNKSYIPLEDGVAEKLQGMAFDLIRNRREKAAEEDTATDESEAPAAAEAEKEYSIEMI